MATLSNRSLTNLAGIHPDLVKVIKEAIKDTPIDFTVTDGIRTIEQQQTLYAKGRTASGKIVTNCDGIKSKSNHQVKSDGFGHAIDLYPYKDGSVQLNDVVSLKTIASHIKKKASELGVVITWGGDWKTIIDYPHFEV